MSGAEPAFPRWRFPLIGFLALTLVACASAGPGRPDPWHTHLEGPADADAGRCARLFADLDDAVAAAGVRDAEAAPVPGFPYLRVNRLLQALAPEAGGEAFERWVDLLQRLDDAGRSVELKNLPLAPINAPETSLPADLAGNRELAAAIGACGVRLRAADLAREEGRERLRAAARVPDAYHTWKRVLGLYWVTRIPFSAGVRGWQRSTQVAFDADLESRAVNGRVVRFAPPPGARLSADRVGEAIRRGRGNPLGIAAFDEETWKDLVATFAPLLEIDVASGDDLIGAPVWDANGAPGVDVSRPVVYARLAHTVHGGAVLPQIVYSFWFPARTCDSEADLLCGQLDGITWRVTLDERGRPWVYDAMHNCGCYHLFFPTARARLRPLPDSLDEAAFVPQRAPDLAAGERVVLRIASRSHYLERLRVAQDGDPGAAAYRIADDDELRSLPLGEDRRRSLFGPDGIVAGSERRERYLFWPMGVPEPGAMRQWGTHATAFVGRRHFDDADLLERYFE
ncbi:MAG: hypothetical protein HYU77_07765 [Betaproteobacteria bacterium]|nr:hypothetical protein [Betaproteobacteria bacterium]